MGKKDWFHSLAYDGQFLSDTHIDVIFYYLRKKAKYDPDVSVRFTTPDWTFGEKINRFYEKFIKKNHDPAVIPDENEISEYIQGFYCDANLPQDTVDHVLMPIHVHRRRKDVGHWVLGVLTFKDRCIYVYDSNRGALNDVLVTQAMLPHAFMMPHFLISTGFYGKRNDIGWSSDAYVDKHYLTLLMSIWSVSCHIVQYSTSSWVKKLKRRLLTFTYHPKIGALLWQYGRKKHMLNVVSDNEVTGRLFKKKRGWPRK